MTSQAITEETLVTLQRWNAELYQAVENRRERNIDDDLLIRIQQKLAREYQHIARMAHWTCLDRYESLAELMVPEQVLDPEYDAVAEAIEWLQARAKPPHPEPCLCCEILAEAEARETERLIHEYVTKPFGP